MQLGRVGVIAVGLALLVGCRSAGANSATGSADQPAASVSLASPASTGGQTGTAAGSGPRAPVDPAQSGSAQSGSAQSGSAQSGSAQSGSAQSGSAQSDQPAATQPPSTTTAAPTGYVPPAEPAPNPGDCPFLPDDDVAFDTGQHTGQTAVSATAPHPVCIFVRSDGTDLATVRVLEFGTAEQAVAAVDYYVPRDTSNPETKPAGWTGGSMATPDGGSIVGVSKGGYAVIAVCNVKSVAARQLVAHAIEHLGW